MVKERDKQRVDDILKSKVFRALQKNTSITKMQQQRGRRLYLLKKHVTRWIDNHTVVKDEWSALWIHNRLMVAMSKSDGYSTHANIDYDDVEHFTLDLSIFNLKIVEFVDKYVRGIINHWENNQFLLHGLALTMRHYTSRLILLAFLHNVTNLQSSMYYTTFEAKENSVINVHRDFFCSSSDTVYAQALIETIKVIEESLTSLKLTRIKYRLGVTMHEVKHPVNLHLSSCVRVSLNLEFEHTKNKYCTQGCITEYERAINELEQIKEELLDNNKRV